MRTIRRIMRGIHLLMNTSWDMNPATEVRDIQHQVEGEV
jgi:hypothetical protein